MSYLQKVYESSPVLLQNLMVTGSGAIKVKRRYGAVYHDYRAWLKDYDSWSLDRMLDHQNQLMREFVKFAEKESTFYKQHFAGIETTSVRTVADLTQLPILEKETLRQQMENIHTVSATRSTPGHTGGTTGKSLVVRFTREDEMKRMAMLDHFKSRHGFENLKMRKATFSGKHLVQPTRGKTSYWRYNASSKQMLYSTFDISESNLAAYVDSLNKFRPFSLDGFFSSLCDVASYIERHNIKLTFTPVAIFPTSETVTARGRALLERVFSAKVYDQYASSEGAPFVTECAAGNLHKELNTGVIEAMPGTSEILVTSFHTHGTPLIRYAIGDAMELDTQEGICECGLRSPRILSIEGRSDDHLLKADGSKVSGSHVSMLFKKLPNAVIQAQAVQETLGYVKILLVVDKLTYRPEHERLLTEEFVHTFGSTTSLEIEYVSEIPRERSGKQRLIKNTVGHN